MSNDLISRAEVLMTLEKIFGEYRISWGSECGGFAAAVPEAVKQIPTAYDIEKVIGQLEKELTLAEAEKIRCSRKNPLQFDSAKGYEMGIYNAIEIVKGSL